ncbi:MAG: hypothetical protein JWR35_2434 [Marmoricola sp.]|nr:hypothetical protein [Marmoricola sp.]
MLAAGRRAGDLQRLPPAVEGPRPPGSPQLWSRSDRRWDRIRYALVIGWLLVIVAAPVFGERTASWGDVRSLVASGQLDTVAVSQEMPPGSTGYSLVELHWRHGWLRYQAQVVQVRGRGESANGAGTTNDRAKVVLRTPPSRLLTSLQPDLLVTRDRGEPHDAYVFGWQVPNAAEMSALLLFLAGFGLLVVGPQPWRGTRWAWFWLLVPPIGSIVFLLLSGPTTGVRRPRRPSRRLTGGWAFLLSIPLMAILAPYRW